MIKVEVIKASRSPEGVILWTLALTYPRFIHAELMTHRVFSRNASSSRAIPIFKSIMAVLRNSASPVSWGSNQPGMQAGKELTGIRRGIVKAAWNAAKYAAVGCAYVAMKAGAHKQVVNRILEPWSHITVLVTTSDWKNWDSLRDHPDADPTIRKLAVQIKLARLAALAGNKVRDLKPGDWHLPYVTEDELLKYGLVNCIKMSVARCARVSYLTHDKADPTWEKDVALYNRLAHHDPMHASPLEHQATPDTMSWQETVRIQNEVTTCLEAGREYDNKKEHGNLYGFRQFRKMVEHGSITMN